MEAERSAATGYEFSFQVFEVTAEEAEALFDATASFVHERADQVFGIGPGPIKDEGDESRVHRFDFDEYICMHCGRDRDNPVHKHV